MRNTMEHGYHDAIAGRQRVLGSDDYREGYNMGFRYMKGQKAIELALLAITGGVVLVSAFLWLTASAAVGPV